MTLSFPAFNYSSYIPAIHTHTHTHTYTRTHTHTHTHKYTNRLIGDNRNEVLRNRISCAKFRFLSTGTGFSVFQSGLAHTRTHLHMHKHIYTNTHTYTHTRAHTHTHTHTYTNVHTNTHTHTQTHTHTILTISTNQTYF